MLVVKMLRWSGAHTVEMDKYLLTPLFSLGLLDSMAVKISHVCRQDSFHSNTKLYPTSYYPQSTKVNHITPQTPSGSGLPLPFPLSNLCNLLTLLTMTPTLTGPMTVHNRIAQVATRKISELPPVAAEPDPNTPVDSARELIKNPISPRATMALPSIAAG